MTDERCALCNQLRPVHDSHIIPEFVYKSLYDDKHRAAALDLRRAYIPYVQKDSENDCCATRANTSSADGKMLSADFGSQRPSSRRRSVSLTSACLASRMMCSSSFTSLFFWRAGVAKSEAFCLVKLGPHEIHLQNILLSEQSPIDAIYPVSACVLRHPRSGAPFEECVMASAGTRI
jgi:hypothetical protein